jgi:hypothetical protein
MSSESVSLFSSKAISTSSSYLGVISLLVGTIQLFAHQKRKKWACLNIGHQTPSLSYEQRAIVEGNYRTSSGTPKISVANQA